MFVGAWCARQLEKHSNKETTLIVAAEVKLVLSFFRSLGVGRHTGHCLSAQQQDELPVVHCCFAFA